MFPIACVASRMASPVTTPDPLALFGSDLVAWYDPSDATTVTQSDGLVSQLSDKSGNGRNLTASGTQRPTYSATGIFQTPGIFFASGNILLSANTFPLSGAFSFFSLSELHEVAGSTDGYLFSYHANGDAGAFSSHSVIPVLTHAGNLDTEYGSNVHPTNSSTILYQSLAGQRLTGGTIKVIGSVWDGTNAQLFLDDEGSTAAAYTNALNTPGVIAFGNRESLLDELWNGYIGESVVIKRSVTSAERKSLTSWLRRKWTKVVVCEGDSIVHEWRTFYDFSHGFIGHDGYTYIAIPNLPSACVINLSIAGTDFWTNPTNSLYVRTAHTNSVLPINKYGQKYVLFFSFSNNLNGAPYYDSLTPQTAQNKADAYKAYCVTAKASGWDKIVLGTVLSRTDAQANDTFRNALNAIVTNPSWNGLAANGGPVDAIADFASDSIMGVDTAPTINSGYFLDQVHPNGAGHARLEPIFTAAVNSV